LLGKRKRLPRSGARQRARSRAPAFESPFAVVRGELFINGDGTLLGAAGVLSGVAEIEEAEVGLLFPQCLREDAQR
jgi:hypothetical protein